MTRHLVRYYKHYRLEITDVGVDVFRHLPPAYVQTKISLREAIRYIRANPLGY